MIEIWGLFCELLPDRDGVRKIVLGHSTFATREEAQAECDKVRRANLPYRAWPVRIKDPRDD